MTATFSEIQNVIEKNGMDAAEKEFSNKQEIAKIISGTQGEITFPVFNDLASEQQLTISD